ncbi:beta-defensin 132 [Lutra lutra]|uniref:beta-defensin 132 n=1 Tax=Lutra lutra TaxID=9657 RepID=UPI001FD45C4B|nr:beta-defensin 132 [Lutra lutra]
MKLLLLVFASFGFLGTPAGGGGASCSRSYPGRCKMHCDSLERSIFMCDRYKLCCVKDLLRTISPPPAHKPKNPCRKSTRRQTKEHRKGVTPESLSFPGIQYGYGIPTKG